MIYYTEAYIDQLRHIMEDNLFAFMMCGIKRVMCIIQAHNDVSHSLSQSIELALALMRAKSNS